METITIITYYAYANKDFTAFESEPKVLFEAKYGSIDNDIIYKDGIYHLFYKGNTKDANGKEIKNGIQQATSNMALPPTGGAGRGAFTEAPWMHKYNGKYYLTYASEWFFFDVSSYEGFSSSGGPQTSG